MNAPQPAPRPKPRPLPPPPPPKPIVKKGPPVDPFAAVPEVPFTPPAYKAPQGAVPGLVFTHDLDLGSFSISLHGAPDSGKTSCAATAPVPFFIATEKATLERLAGMGARIPYLWAGTSKEFRGAIEKARVIMPKIGARTLVIDTFSTLADTVLAEILNQVRAYYADDDKEDGIEHFDPKIDGQVWNEVFRRQNDMRRRIDSLGCSVIYVCHTRISSGFGGAMGGEIESGVPDAQGSFRQRLLRFPGATFYVHRRITRDPVTKQQKSKVVLYTQRNADGMEARCKWPGLDAVEPANIQFLIEKVKQHFATREGQ